MMSVGDDGAESTHRLLFAGRRELLLIPLLVVALLVRTGVALLRLAALTPVTGRVNIREPDVSHSPLSQTRVEREWGGT